MSGRWCGMLALALGIWTVQAAAQDAVDADGRWAHAAAWEEQEKWEEAVAVYDRLVADYPASQKAVVRRGAARFEAGQLQQALADAEKCISLNPHSRVWAEWGYLCKARACRGLNRQADARAAISIMKTRFPDSISTARAELLEAEMDAKDTAAAAAAVALEEEAEALHEQANAASKAGDAETALRLFDQVIAEYPTTRKSLRSMEIKALLLGLLPDRTDDAIDAWLDVLDRVGDTAPQARIVQEARMRLAALYHRQGKLSEALTMYADLARSARATSVMSNAALQAAGLYFEILQRRRWDGDPIPPSSWSELRTMCAGVGRVAGSSVAEQATADLMDIESYAWQGQSQQAVAAGTKFLAKYDATAVKEDAALARFFVGEELQKLGRHKEALALFRQIAAAYAGNTEIIAGMDHLPRTYFRIWESLYAIGASEQEVTAAAEALLSRFPNSSYAEHIRIATRKEGQ